jgi:4-hydroxyacetophenone monooxygenase
MSKPTLALSQPERDLPPDPSFLRQALESADLNVVRIALYQQTHDPELEKLHPTRKLDAAAGRMFWAFEPDERDQLIAKAAAWLEQNASTREPEEPSEDELRKMFAMALGKEMGQLEFECRRDLPSFKPFPYSAQWPAGQARPKVPEGFKVAIIGSGFSGISAAVQMEQLGLPYVVLERRAEIGGVWNINRYPEVRVDTISVTYEFPFEKKTQWSDYFAPGPEVRRYLNQVSTRQGVSRHTRFNSDVKKASFDEARNVWRLEVHTPRGVEQMEANFVISAAGLFANPKIGDFRGREAFKGAIVHPTAWPTDLDLKGKRVAIIGNGSTGVQMLAPIAREAAQVRVFQRTPQWISPRHLYGKPVEAEVNWLIGNFPGYWNWWRFMELSGLFDTHDLMLTDKAWQEKGGKVNQQNDWFRDFLTGYIKRETNGRQDLIDKLIPDYAPLSRRPVVDNGWYRALTRDNVELVTDGIERFVPNGVQTTDGQVREVDVIVTATGFEVGKFLFPAAYKGLGGRDLHEHWEAGDGPRTYRGMMVPEFPNLFMLYGPNSQPVSGGPALPFWLMMWAGYAAQCIMRTLEQGKSRVDVKQEAFASYNKAMDAEAWKLVHMTKEGGMDKNYYVDAAHGRLLTSAPWYAPKFQHMCTHVDWEDLEIT